MSEPFNVNQYWLKRGQSYIGEERLALEYHRIQERFLFHVLREGRIPMQRILELGCGFGRVTKLLAQNFPGAEIAALDLSPDQLANARHYCAGCGNITFHPYDFYSGAPFPGTDYDTVVAIEVFLHHPPEMIQGLIERLATVSEYLVNIDWSESWPWKTPAHVWVHDYAALYRKAGLDWATFRLPEKVEGKQQKLFVAGKALPSEVVALEQKLRESEPPAAESRPGASAANPASSEAWLQQLQLVEKEITELVPRGHSFILVDDNQWGVAGDFVGRRALPFLERDGQYWGAPANDETAIRELERLKQAGATHIAIAWPSFWWLTHYAGFRRYLRTFFPCVLENERVIVFRLEW